MELVSFNVSLIVLSVLFLLVSSVYASVGLGGGSSYTAILALFGVSAAKIAPVALSLNLVVAGIAFFAFLKNDFVQWSILLPVVVVSVPASFTGGWMSFDNRTVLAVLGLALAVASVFLSLNQKWNVGPIAPSFKWPLLGMVGAGLGFLAGMTGIGGGIFLVPVLILFGLAGEQQTAPVAAAFVWLNSAAGLIGHAGNGQVEWAMLLPLAGAVAAGGWIGSKVGASGESQAWVRRVASIILAIAALQIFIRFIG